MTTGASRTNRVRPVMTSAVEGAPVGGVSVIETGARWPSAAGSPSRTWHRGSAGSPVPARGRWWWPTPGDRSRGRGRCRRASGSTGNPPPRLVFDASRTSTRRIVMTELLGLVTNSSYGRWTLSSAPSTGRGSASAEATTGVMTSVMGAGDGRSLDDDPLDTACGVDEVVPHPATTKTDTIAAMSRRADIVALPRPRRVPGPKSAHCNPAFRAPPLRWGRPGGPGGGSIESAT